MHSLNNRGVHTENLRIFPNCAPNNKMDYRQKMVVPSSQKLKHEEDDDEDLEALRLAALKSLRAKHTLQSSQQPGLLSQQVKPRVGYPSCPVYNHQRQTKRGYYQNRVPRQNGNTYYPSRVNQNLIEIVPVEEAEPLQKDISPTDVNFRKNDIQEDAYIGGDSKFYRYKDNASGSEEDDTKESDSTSMAAIMEKERSERERGKESGPKRDKRCIVEENPRERVINNEESEQEKRLYEEEKKKKKKEEEVEGDDEEVEEPEEPEEEEEEEDENVANDDDDDVLLMADLEEEDSLERLMDEMEREMNVDKREDKMENKLGKKESKESKRSSEVAPKARSRKSRIERDRIDKNGIGPTSSSLPGSKNERTSSVSPRPINRTLQKRRSLSPKARPRRKSPRRSPRRSPPKLVNKTFRDATRARSPRKLSPRPRSPRRSPVNARSPVRRSPPLRRLSPSGISARSRSPRIRRSRSPRGISRSKSPKRSNRSRSPRQMIRSKSPARGSPMRLSPRARTPPRSKSPRFSPARRASPKKSVATVSPSLPPSRLRSPGRSPWSSPRNSPRVSPRRRRSPKESTRKTKRGRSVTPEEAVLPMRSNCCGSSSSSSRSSGSSSIASTLSSSSSSSSGVGRGASSNNNSATAIAITIVPTTTTATTTATGPAIVYKRSEASPLRKAISSSDTSRGSKGKQKEAGAMTASGSVAKDSIDPTDDPIFEARRRKFENNRPIDPVHDNKKIKLGKKDDASKMVQVEPPAQADAPKNSHKPSRIIEEYEDEDDEDDVAAAAIADENNDDDGDDRPESNLCIRDDYVYEVLEDVTSDASSTANPISMRVEMVPVKVEKEGRTKKKKKRDKELYQVGKMKGELPLSERIGKEKKCKKRKERVTSPIENSPEREAVVSVDDLSVDEEADLRTELSRRRAERLNRAAPIQSARLLQSAFKGVVNEAAKTNAKAIQRHAAKADEKGNKKEVRRVTVLHRTVTDLLDTEEDGVVVDSKVPIRFRLGINKPSAQDSRETSKPSRKSSKRQARKISAKRYTEPTMKL